MVIQGEARHPVQSIAQVKQRLLEALVQPGIVDLAFIGNTSTVYEWDPCRMIDLDCFIFAERLDRRLGSWLVDVRNDLTNALAERATSFELRIIEGPYKPSTRRLERPVIVAHLGLFTEASYRLSPPIKRWAWRKYRCERDPDRLQRHAPNPPTLAEFVHDAKGLEERLSAIRQGRVVMTEWLLPTLEICTFATGLDDPAFQECCFAYCANTARNHARALRFDEADKLGNEHFFQWYDKTLFPSRELLELMRLKARCRQCGFDQETAFVRDLALAYLEPLYSALSEQISR